jgi:type III pantothenate kinase
LLLAIDIGNTNLHFGLWWDDAWKFTWRARTVHNKMADEYAVLLRNFLGEIDLDFKRVEGVVMASVVPALTDTFCDLSHRYFGAKPLVVDHKTNAGVRIDIELPEQVGADRIVNTAAVCALMGGGPAIVIDFGTATTFDVISRDGAYIGGAISPGINLAADALASQTARLFKVNLVPPPSAIGRNTTQALQSGIFLGYLGLVEGLVERIKAALPAEDRADTKVIATGGLAPLFDKHSPLIHQVADLLTLDGLRVIWEINHPAA